MAYEIRDRLGEGGMGIVYLAGPIRCCNGPWPIKILSARYPDLSTLSTELGQIRERPVGTPGDTTIVRGRPGGPSRPPSAPTPAGVRTPTPGGRNIPNLEELARRRRARIESHIRRALEHLEQGRFEAAVEECEQAVLIDPQEPGALELLDRAHRAIDDRRLAEWLADVRAELARGALSEAGVLIQQSLQLRPDSTEAQ